MDIATFDKERFYAQEGTLVIGVDEAGRGPLAGPVVAAACVLKCAVERVDTDNSLWDFVRDSKTVGEKKRDAVYDFVLEHFHVGVGVASPETIDRMNILQATFFAMKAAHSDLTKNLYRAHRIAGDSTEEVSHILLIDGNQLIPHFSPKQVCVTAGDSKVKSIAAASIIAKVTRDRMMIEYEKMFPAYGFAGHKGYGTKKHMEALRTHGATPIHRKSFAPVKRVL